MTPLKRRASLPALPQRAPFAHGRRISADRRFFHAARATIEHAAREAEKRLRPVLMTTLVATLGLLPAAVSNGIGSQTQKPLALVVIGGSLILAVLNRAVQPPLLLLVHGWKARRAVRG